MKKSEIISAIAASSGLTKKDSEKALSAVVEVITNALIAGDRVQLAGFGVFGIKNRAARTGRNPKTKEPISIPETRTPQFKPGKALKEAVAK